MPEGDTIHRTVRRLARALVGKSVVRVVGSVTSVTRAGLEGRRVDAVEAVGKNLTVRFDDGRVLHTHMRMTGEWHLYRSGERWWRPEHEARVALEVAPANGDPALVAVCFAAPVVKLDAAARVDAKLAVLGPDVLADTFDAAEAVARLRAAPARPIGDALMDQRALAGVGNVYKSEVLFAERVDPRAPVSALDDATLARLVATARSFMKRNAAAGSTVARTTTRGFAAGPLAVYRRSGRACPRCGASIARIVQGALNRATYFCPRCQGAPPPNTLPRGAAVRETSSPNERGAPSAADGAAPRAGRAGSSYRRPRAATVPRGSRRGRG
jgi:endonuclease-8